MLRTLTLASFLSLGLLACSGGSKPAPAAPDDPGDHEEDTDLGTPELCCCDYILEAGEGDTMSENETWEMMSPTDCEANSGTCADDSACAGHE